MIHTLDLGAPYTAVLSSADGDVLRVLAGSTRPFTGREVARLAGCSHSTVQRSLDRLVEHGLARREPAGRAALYTLNRDHLAVPAVEALTSLRATLIERLKEALADWDPAPTHASVFGSAARGDGGTDSDIDLLLVRPDQVDEEDRRWRGQIDELASSVQRWTGNRLAPLELDASEVQRLARDRPPLVDELRSDAIALVGPRIRTLLGPR